MSHTEKERWSRNLLRKTTQKRRNTVQGELQKELMKRDPKAVKLKKENLVKSEGLLQVRAW